MNILSKRIEGMWRGREEGEALPPPLPLLSLSPCFSNKNFHLWSLHFFYMQHSENKKQTNNYKLITKIKHCFCLRICANTGINKLQIKKVLFCCSFLLNNTKGSRAVWWSRSPTELLVNQSHSPSEFRRLLVHLSHARSNRTNWFGHVCAGAIWI